MSLIRSIWIFLALALGAGTVLPQPPFAQSAAAPQPNSAPSVDIFQAGLRALGFAFKAKGSFGGGANHGEIVRIVITTGEQVRIDTGVGWSWPIGGPDNTRGHAFWGNQVWRVPRDPFLSPTPIGAEADWIKLLGELPDGTILGLVQGELGPRRAVLSPDGRISALLEAETTGERRETALLAQEERDYADGRRLEMRRSERGGRGFDVFLVDGGRVQNLSDCGDDACGQPSLSPDGTAVHFIRSRRR